MAGGLIGMGVTYDCSCHKRNEPCDACHLYFWKLIKISRSKWMRHVNTFTEYMLQFIKLSKLPLCKGSILARTYCRWVVLIFLIHVSWYLYHTLSLSYLEVSKEVNNHQKNYNNRCKNNVHQSGKQKPGTEGITQLPPVGIFQN